MKQKITLTDFKRWLQSAKNHGITLKSTVYNKANEAIRKNDFAAINIIQSNAFTLLRNNKNSWAEYGKASEWNFENGIIKRNFLDGGYIIFEFSEPTFFSNLLN